MCRDYPAAIAASDLTIYDEIKESHPELWVPTQELEILLDCKLCGDDLSGLALRTRSKKVKELVCQALGYPVPSSFRKTQPRFEGQIFDTYVQKANNLQVWNEGLSPTRRYVILRIDENDKISRVKVVNGEELARFDTTGTLTQKYQARLNLQDSYEELVAANDTNALRGNVQFGHTLAVGARPIDNPVNGHLLPIAEVFSQLRVAIGRSFDDPGHDQERVRGERLRSLVCELLGYCDFLDDGRFPDLRNQLLEVKLQTSPTIDLGLVQPSSEDPLDMPMFADTLVRPCDVRYALFYGRTDGATVTLTHFFLTTGENFFVRFPQCGGNLVNKKLQIPLPSNFFDR